MTAATIAAEVAAAFEEAGREVGDGQGALEVSILRPTAPTGDGWNPTPGAPVAFKFSAIETELTNRDLDNPAIQSTDIKYLLAVGPVSPTASDDLLVNATHYSIKYVKRVAPAGEVIMWEVFARGGQADAQIYEQGDPLTYVTDVSFSDLPEIP